MSVAKKTTSKAKLTKSSGVQKITKFLTPTADKQIQRRPIRTQQEVKNSDINEANNIKKCKQETRVIDIRAKTDPKLSNITKVDPSEKKVPHCNIPC